jgi:hypothetical protein
MPLTELGNVFDGYFYKYISPNGLRDRVLRGVMDVRSGVVEEVCGALPTRRYGAGPSAARSTLEVRRW